jgi:hypothetical protein
MKAIINWEHENLDKWTSRVKVLGGWIVTIENTKHTAMSSIFIPDAPHQWIVNKKDEEILAE